MNTIQSTSNLAASNGHNSRHAVAVDVVLFIIEDATLKVLLIRRNQSPFEGEWALPGGMVKPDESLDNAALRVQKSMLEQLILDTEISKKGTSHKTIECDKGLKINTDRLNRGIYYDGLE